MEDREQEMKDILQSFADLAEEYNRQGKYLDIVKDVEATKWALKKIENLEQQRDYYKARYLETNDGIIEAGKILTKRGE